MTPAPHIRAARLGDEAEILAMIRELAEFEQLAHEVNATAADLAAALFGERPAAEALVAEVGGVVAGYALFFAHFSTFAGRAGIYLEDLYVRPPFRGRGLGRKLLLRVGALASARGCARYEWLVLDWNARAIAFYESVGAEMHAAWRVMRVSGPALGKMAALDAAEA